MSSRPVALEKSDCPICGDHSHRRRGEKSGYPIRECNGCRALFVPAGAIPDLTDFYARYYDRATFTVPSTVAASLENLVRAAAGFRRTGRWLDIGYGEGGLLEIVEAHGWACYGTEIASSVLDHGRRRGWTVASDAAGDGRFTEQSFDVVTMIELLEHVPAPIRWLEHAARWLRPGGLLYVTTPNAGSLNHRLLGLEWSAVAPPEHLVLWTVNGLHRALTRVGIVPLRMRTEGCNPSELVARLRWRRGARVAVDRNQSAVALSEALARSRLRRTVKAVINQLLSTSRLGDTIKVWAIRRGR